MPKRLTAAQRARRAEAFQQYQAEKEAKAAARRAAARRRGSASERPADEGSGQDAQADRPAADVDFSYLDPFRAPDA